MRSRFCESGKVAYDSEEQAAAYAEAYNLTRGDKRTMRQYQCKECRYWHNFTDKDANRRTRKKKRQVLRQRATRALVLAVWEGEGGTVL